MGLAFCVHVMFKYSFLFILNTKVGRLFNKFFVNEICVLNIGEKNWNILRFRLLN